MQSRATTNETSRRMQTQSLYDRDFAAWVGQQGDPARPRGSTSTI